MDEATMQVFAMGREFALASGLATSDAELPFAVFPGETTFPGFLDAPFFIVIVRVVRAELPVQLALETADRLVIRRHLGTAYLQTWRAFSRDELTALVEGPRSKPPLSGPARGLGG